MQGLCGCTTLLLAHLVIHCAGNILILTLFHVHTRHVATGKMAGLEGSK